MPTSLSNFTETQLLQTSTPNKQSPVLNGLCALNGSVTLSDPSPSQPTEESDNLATASLDMDHSTTNRQNADSDIVRKRLLNLLAEMIPHSETLSIRLLMNYTIDDKDCQSVVIDELLNRNAKRPNGTLNQLFDSQPKRSCTDQDRCPAVIDSTALDLSVNLNRSNDKPCLVKNHQLDNSILKKFNASTHQFEPLNINKASSIPLGVMFNPNQQHTSSLLQEFPLLDTPLLALLPLLQQQQQQQFNFNPLSNLSIQQVTVPPIPNNTTKVFHSSVNTTSLCNTVTPSTLNANLISKLNSNSNCSQSIIGLPLLNPFGQDLMLKTDLLPFSSCSTSSINLDPIDATSNVTSLNLGSATLLNLKNKTTGQESVGIVPDANSKTLNQPVVSILNQFSTNPISIRALSQLFNGTSTTAPTTHYPLSYNTLMSTAGPTLNVLHSNLNIAPSLNNNSNMVDALTNSIAATNNGHDPSFKTDLTAANDGNDASTKDLIRSINATLSANHEASLEQAKSKRPPATKWNQDGKSGQFLFGRRLTHNKRFTCNQCRKNFVSLAELNRHTMDAHSSFRCTICSARFTQRSNLQRHSLKHVGFKPFTCNLCDKEYYRKDHLVRHIEVTHPTHDPKMNITVHLTSSECLDYLDRLHAVKPTDDAMTKEDCADASVDDNRLLIVEDQEELAEQFKIEENGLTESN